jgi:hypothetical protein
MALAAGVWVASLAPVRAATYFVATTGSDAGDGSHGAPWRSVTNAVARAGAGDLIQVGAGIYTQSVAIAKTNLPFADSGNNITNRDPLYFDAANNNYHLRGDSPAFNSGIDLTAAGVTNDIAGAARPQFDVFDRGAYEESPLQKGTILVIR